MILILDISNPVQWRPGKFVGPFNGKSLVRVWWLWFAVTYCKVSDYDYWTHIASGKTEWRLR